MAEFLRERITDGTYPRGHLLPTQRQLAAELKVSRDTVQRALRQLVEAGLIEARQGSGSRVVRVPSLGPLKAPGALPGVPSLEPLIRQAFEERKVSLDVFTLTSETLVSHLAVQEDRILRAREIRPEELRIRMLLPAEDAPLAYPRAKDPDDPRIWVRWRTMARRHTRKVRQVVDRLADAGVDARLEIQRVPMTPQFKLYILNDAHMLFGPYEVIDTVIPLEDEDETQVDSYDVLGAHSALTYHGMSEGDHAAAFFESMRGWFDSNWDILSEASSRKR